MCTVLLPPGLNPIAVEKYIVSDISYIIFLRRDVRIPASHSRSVVLNLDFDIRYNNFEIFCGFLQSLRTQN